MLAAYVEFVWIYRGSSIACGVGLKAIARNRDICIKEEKQLTVQRNQKLMLIEVQLSCGKGEKRAEFIKAGNQGI